MTYVTINDTVQYFVILNIFNQHDYTGQSADGMHYLFQVFFWTIFTSSTPVFTLPHFLHIKIGLKQPLFWIYTTAEFLYHSTNFFPWYYRSMATVCFQQAHILWIHIIGTLQCEVFYMDLYTSLKYLLWMSLQHLEFKDINSINVRLITLQAQ